MPCAGGWEAYHECRSIGFILHPNCCGLKLLPRFNHGYAFLNPIQAISAIIALYNTSSGRQEDFVAENKAKQGTGKLHTRT